MAFKGFAGPIPTYQLERATSVGEPFFTTPLLGREAELDQLLAEATAALHGRAAALLIYGEAGVGKSRLTFALRTALGARVTWLTGPTDSILRQPFNPFIYLLKTYLHVAPTHPVVEQRRALQRRLQWLAYHPRVQATPAAAELLRTASFLAALLNLHEPNSLYAQLTDPALRYQNTLLALRTFVWALSQLQPVVLELEDVQWLDDASRAALLTLTRDLAGVPLLVVATVRYADDGSRPEVQFASDLPTATLTLGALPAAALRQQAMHLLGGPVNDALYAMLRDRTQGNPFFAQQFLYYLRDQNYLAPAADGAWQLAPGAQPELPASVTALLIARLDRLPAPVKAVVQTAAVLGREFDLRLLQEVLHAAALAEVQTAEHEQIWGALAEQRYLFKHALLREAAYDMQLRAQLRALHQQAAEALETLHAANLAPYSGEIAYHYERAYTYGATALRYRAGHALHQAGEAAAMSAYATAVQFYVRAVALVPHLSAWWRALGEAHHGLGDSAAGQHALHQALTTATSAADRAAALVGLGLEARRVGHYAEAQQLLAEALPLARACGDPLTLCRVLYGLGDVNWPLGRLAEARGALNESLALARALGDVPRELLALNRLGTVALQQDLAEAEQLFQSVYVRAVAVGHRVRAMAALNNLGEVAIQRQDYVAAQQSYQQALAMAREMGAQRDIALYLINLGYNAVHLGQLAAARAGLREGLALTLHSGMAPTMALAVMYFGALAQAEGETARACALWGLAQRHPTWSSDHQRELEAMLAQTALAPAVVEAGLAQGAALDWDTTIQALLSPP